MSAKYYKLIGKEPHPHATLTLNLRSSTGQDRNIQVIAGEVFALPTGVVVRNLQMFKDFVQMQTLEEISAREAAEYLYQEKNWKKDRLQKFLDEEDQEVLDLLPDKNVKATSVGMPKPLEASPTEALAEDTAEAAEMPILDREVSTPKTKPRAKPRTTPKKKS